MFELTLIFLLQILLILFKINRSRANVSSIDKRTMYVDRSNHHDIVFMEVDRVLRRYPSYTPQH